MATMDIVSVYDEFLEYLAQKAAPEEVIAFKASPTQCFCDPTASIKQLR